MSKNKKSGAGIDLKRSVSGKDDLPRRKSPPTTPELRSAASIMGSKGGLARGRKGLAAVPKRRRMEIIRKGTRAAAVARTARARERRRAEGAA